MLPPSSEPSESEAPEPCLAASRPWRDAGLSMPLPALQDEEGPRLPEGLPPVVDSHVHLFPDRVFEAVWRWFDVPADTPADGPGPALAHEAMPGSRWFTDVRLNYAGPNPAAFVRAFDPERHRAGIDPLVHRWIRGPIVAGSRSTRACQRGFPAAAVRRAAGPKCVTRSRRVRAGWRCR